MKRKEILKELNAINSDGIPLNTAVDSNLKKLLVYALLNIDSSLEEISKSLGKNK